MGVMVRIRQRVKKPRLSILADAEASRDEAGVGNLLGVGVVCVHQHVDESVKGADQSLGCVDTSFILLLLTLDTPVSTLFRIGFPVLPLNPLHEFLDFSNVSEAPPSFFVFVPFCSAFKVNPFCVLRFLPPHSDEPYPARKFGTRRLGDRFAQGGSVNVVRSSVFIRVRGEAERDTGLRADIVKSSRVFDGIMFRFGFLKLQFDVSYQEQSGQ